MTSWNRRMNVAARVGAARTERAEVLGVALEMGVVADDVAALSSLATLARERPGFRNTLLVRAVGADGEREVLFEIVHEDGGARVSPVDAADAPAPAPPPPDPEPPEGGLTGDRILRILTDTQVETPDMVAVFAGVGQQAVWANDAFATMIPIRESDRIWLVELLDEWSQGNFEVKVMPALVKYGRWRGRLTFLTGDPDGLRTSAVVVAHRDRSGEIEAVCMVARDLTELQLASDAVTRSETRLDALVEHASEIIAVTTTEGIVQYASPATERILGVEAGALVGSDLLELAHPDDRPAGGLSDLVQPDDRGFGIAVELRLRRSDGTWRHLEVVVTDLTGNPAIGGYVLNARDVTDRVAAVAALAGRAYVDPLTELPNRVRLLDRIATALGDPARVGSTVVALVDLDGFKSVNARLGGDAGNEILRRVAARMRDEAPDSVTVARLGSDEFVLLLGAVGNVAEALHVASRVRAAIGRPIEIDDERVQVTASIGVAVARPGQEPEDLLRDADTAMTHAKAQGRDRIELYDTELERTTVRRRSVEDKLRHALDNEGVRVHYQPIVDIRSGSVVAGEALLRVHDDEGALLSPAEFIDAAENSGLIARLGSQVLQLTCQQLAAWSHQSSSAVPREISVNISPRQLADPDLPTRVVQALESAGVSPDRLWLEITESILIGAQPTVDASISYLRALGVRIGLDDFGAGQSSLGYLKRFPLDFVKIDRGLISGLGANEADTAIVRATVELCRTIGLTTVAVGVENDEQLEYLEILGCDRAQGYLFAPPVPPEDFLARSATIAP